MSLFEKIRVVIKEEDAKNPKKSKAQNYSDKINKQNKNRKEFEYAKSKESKTFKGTVTQGSNKGRSYTINRNPPPKGIDKNLNKAEVKLRDAKKGRNMKTGQLNPIYQDLGKRAARGEPKAVQFTIDMTKDYRRGRGLGKKAERKFDASGGKKTGTLRKGNLSFPGDRTGAYSRAKNQLDFDKALKKARGGTKGDIAPEAPKSVKDYAKGVRDKRIKDLKLPDTSFDAKPSKKPIRPFGNKKVTTSAPGFGKGDTPGQTKIKAMDKKAFVKTPYAEYDQIKQPRGVKIPGKTYKNFRGGTRNISSMNPSEMQRAFGTSSTEGSAGVSGSTKTVTPTKPQKSASGSEYTKKINQANKNRKEFAGNKKSFQAFKKQADAASDKLVSKREVVRSTSGTKDVKQIKNINKQIQSTERISKQYDLASKGKGNLKNPIVKASDLKQVTANTPKITSNVTQPPKGKVLGGTTTTPPKPQLPKFTGVTAKGNPSRAISPSFKIGSQATIKDISKQKGALKLPKNYKYYAGAKKIAAKSPFAKKAIVGAGKVLGKLGTKGRIAAAGLSLAAANPGVRNFIGKTALFSAAAGALGLAKPNKKVLKVGDGLTKVSNMPSKYQPKGMKSGTFKEPGSNKVRGTGDVRVRFDLASGGGRKRNPKDVSRVKNIQKKYIDSYNASVKGNPLKKQIKYNVNKDGSYTVTPPKKK